MKRWSEGEERALTRAYGRVLSGMASGCRPPPDRLYAEFIRCNGGATTRSRNAVVVKAGALWSACRSVRAFDQSGGRSWFSLDLPEKRRQSRRMGNSKGLVSLAESVYSIFGDYSPSRAAGVPRRHQVREAQPEQPAEAAGVPRHHQVREAQPEQPAEAAKSHSSKTHKERHLDLTPPHGKPSAKSVQLESACTSDAESDDDYSPQKPSLKKSETGHDFEAILRGVVTAQWGQVAEVERKLQTNRSADMMRMNEYVLQCVKSNPPATRESAQQIEAFLTRQGKQLLESLALHDKQEERAWSALRWG